MAQKKQHEPILDGLRRTLKYDNYNVKLPLLAGRRDSDSVSKDNSHDNSTYKSSPESCTIQLYVHSECTFLAGCPLSIPTSVCFFFFQFLFESCGLRRLVYGGWFLGLCQRSGRRRQWITGTLSMIIHATSCSLVYMVGTKVFSMCSERANI